MRMLGQDVLTQQEFDDFTANVMTPLISNVAELEEHLHAQEELISTLSKQNRILQLVIVTTAAIAAVAIILAMVV